MKAIVTGTNGTVAPVLVRVLEAAGHTVVAWDRARVPADDRAAARAFLHAERPDWCFHLATGSPAWAEEVARLCAQQRVAFLFTSSVSVFSAAQQGPFSIERVPQPADEYGRYKLECERRVRAAHPEARVVRLGWQIGVTPGANHMVDHLVRTMREEGEIKASTAWYQACSFLDDTAEGLLTLMERLGPGLYHLDGNPGLDFYEIVSGLKRMLEAPWSVVPTETPIQNNLLRDARLAVRPITERFGTV